MGFGEVSRSNLKCRTNDLDEQQSVSALRLEFKVAAIPGRTFAWRGAFIATSSLRTARAADFEANTSPSMAVHPFYVCTLPHAFGRLSAIDGDSCRPRESVILVFMSQHPPTREPTLERHLVGGWASDAMSALPNRQRTAASNNIRDIVRALLQQLDPDYYRSALLLVAHAELERLRQERPTAKEVERRSSHPFDASRSAEGSASAHECR